MGTYHGMTLKSVTEGPSAAPRNRHPPPGHPAPAVAGKYYFNNFLINILVRFVNSFLIFFRSYGWSERSS